MTDSAPQKRLFIAFPVELKSQLSTAIKRVKINAQQKEMEFHWVPTPNFHVTLCFLGNTDVSRIREIEEAMKAVASTTPPLETSLRGMGAFPDELHMRVLWVGVRKTRALGSLQEKLVSSLRDLGLVAEEREYLPHLTVGRLRKSRSGKDLISPYVRTQFGEIEIASITLYESVLHGANPVYVPLLNTPLAGASTEDLEEFK